MYPGGMSTDSLYPPGTSGADGRLAADTRLGSCAGCPRGCRADRRAGALGWCRSGAGAEVAAVCLHRGEEPAISGPRGIANVFFAGCNLRCSYCQNWQISRPKKGSDPLVVKGSDPFFASLDAAAAEVERLLAAGASGVGFVSTAHVVPQVEALAGALRARGAAVPFVLNTNAYECPESLRDLFGLMDVYLPDFKYADPELAARLSGARNYPEVALAALRMMHARAGSELVLDEESGVALRGLIVRHLVLPGHVGNSLECLRTLARELSPEIWLSLMAQYRPTPQVAGDPDLGRRLRPEEYAAVLEEADRLGFEHGWRQELDSAEAWNPDFDRDRPFDNPRST
jgi:putative pyruvate formate lyase activating enzyme